jgi:glycosyltransferase involved in cell wall biosynthesis
MVTLNRRTPSLPLETGLEANRFLLITSDWRLTMQPGGVSSYLYSLAQGLINLGDRVKILAVVQPDETRHLSLVKKYEPWVVPFQLVDDSKPVNWLGRKSVSFLEILRCVSPRCRSVLERAGFFQATTAAITSLERFLSKEEPTAIVFGNFNVKLYALALMLLERQRPYGIIAHGWDVRRVLNSKNDFVKRETMLKGAGWIAANSYYTKSLLEMWPVSSERIKIVHPPISEEAVRESDAFEPVFRDNNDLALVTVCRLVKDKGIHLVMHALKILAARGIPFRFVIGGDGPERRSLEELAVELGVGDRVQFKGYVDGGEKWRILRSSDVFVMPSRADTRVQQESFGIAFLEAAAFGVPAVGSKIGGIPDAVVDGETGILVAEESPTDLADALTFLYRKPEIRKEMGRAARERARSQFTPEFTAARIKEEALNLWRDSPTELILGT